MGLYFSIYPVQDSVFFRVQLRQIRLKKVLRRIFEFIGTFILFFKIHFKLAILPKVRQRSSPQGKELTSTWVAIQHTMMVAIPPSDEDHNNNDNSYQGCKRYTKSYIDGDVSFLCFVWCYWKKEILRKLILSNRSFLFLKVKHKSVFFLTYDIFSEAEYTSRSTTLHYRQAFFLNRTKYDLRALN